LIIIYNISSSSIIFHHHFLPIYNISIIIFLLLKFTTHIWSDLYNSPHDRNFCPTPHQFSIIV